MVDPPNTKKKELTNEEKFKILNDWAIEKGVIGLDNVKIPSTFSENLFPVDQKFGVTGVGARVDIEHRKAILACPFSMLISTQTFKAEEPELYNYVVNECPDLFSKEDCLDYE